MCTTGFKNGRSRWNFITQLQHWTDFSMHINKSGPRKVSYISILFCFVVFVFFVILTDTDWHWTHPAGIVCLIVKKARRAEMWILVTKNQNAASLRAATVWSSPPHLDVYTSVEEVCFFLQPFVVCSGAFFFFCFFFSGCTWHTTLYSLTFIAMILWRITLYR